MKKRNSDTPKKAFYMKFNVQDFMTSKKLRDCSAEANGVYIHLLCVLFGCEEKGKLLMKDQYTRHFAQFLLKQNLEQSNKQLFKHLPEICLHFAPYLAKHLPFEKEVIETGLFELLENDVLYIEGNFLCQSRMVRDHEVSQMRAKAGKAGGQKTQSDIKKKLLADSDLAEDLLKHKSEQKSNSNSSYNNNSKEDNKGVINNMSGGMGEENSGGKEEELKNEEKKQSKIEFGEQDRNGIPIRKIQLDALDMQLLANVGEEFRATWVDFMQTQLVDHRKEYKSFQSKNSVYEKLMMLADMDQAKAVKIMKQSMENNWATLHPLDERKLGSKNTQQAPVSSTAKIDEAIAAETDPEKRRALQKEKYTGAIQKRVV